MSALPAFRKTLLAQAVVMSLAVVAPTSASAAASSCTSTTANTISSTVTDTCFLDSSGSVNVTSPNGMINVTANQGVNITGAAVSITNSGTISTPNGSAIGTTGSTSTLSGSITNSGLISSTLGDGILIGLESTVTGGITNSGTISSTNALRLINNANAFVVDNTGTLTGNVNLGINTLNINGNSSIAEGIIVSGAGGTVNINGSLTRASGNTLGASTINITSGGTLNIGNTTIIGNGGTVQVDGTLNVATGMTAMVSGTYTQSASGTFQTEVSSNTSFGKLASPMGSINLPANAKIDVDVIGSPALSSGTVLSSVISASTLNASTFAVTDNSALFNFIAALNGNAVDLTIAAANTSPTQTSVNSTGNRAGRGAAAVFDSLLTMPGTLAPVITALGQLGTDQEVSDAVSRTLPLSTGLKDVAITSLRMVDRVIQARVEGKLGLSAGDDVEGDRHFWIKPVGSSTDQDDLNGVSGYEADSHGLVAGVDKNFSDTVRAGVAVSYASSDIDGKSSASTQDAKIYSYRLIGYASYATDKNTEVNVQVDYGTSKTRGDRRVNLGGATVAKSKYDSWNAHIGAGIARSIPLSAKTSISPSLRLDYTYIEDDSYTETGAGVLNLSVTENDVDELLIYAEGKLVHELTTSTNLLASLGAGYDFLAERDSVTAAFTGGGGNFVTEGFDSSPWLVRAGLGLSTNTKNVEISARYDVEFREKFDNQIFSVKFRMPF